MSDDKQQPRVVYVDHLPDLMDWDDYDVAHEKRVVKFEIHITENGVEILGDCPYPALLEKLLEGLEPDIIEMMMCG